MFLFDGLLEFVLLCILAAGFRWTKDFLFNIIQIKTIGGQLSGSFSKIAHNVYYNFILRLLITYFHPLPSQSLDLHTKKNCTVRLLGDIFNFPLVVATSSPVGTRIDEGRRQKSICVNQIFCAGVSDGCARCSRYMVARKWIIA